MEHSEHSISDILEYVDDILCEPIEIFQLEPPFREQLEVAIEKAAIHFNVKFAGQEVYSSLHLDWIDENGPIIRANYNIY